MLQKQAVPPGFREDAKGRLVPVSKIKPIDKARDVVVLGVCALAEKMQGDLLAFKAQAMDGINAFIADSLSEYDVKAGGDKGNITLVSFDGRYKIVRQVQDSIAFDERLQAAKALIDQCIQAWSKGSNDNIKVLVNDAFQVDNQGKINTARVLALRRLDIQDETWLRAMQAIADSMRVASTKQYIRFYKRNDATGGYEPITLDLAAL